MTHQATISGQRFELDSRAVSRTMRKVLPEPIRGHFVVVAGKRYPPKQVISRVTGLDRADFTTHQARRVLRRLGFVAGRRAPERGKGSRSRGSDPGSAETLRPFIGQWVATKGDEVLVAADGPAAVVSWLEQHGQRADSMFRVPEDEVAAGGAAPA